MGVFDEIDRETRATLQRYRDAEPPTAEEKAWIARLRRVMKDKPHHLLLKASLGSIAVWRVDDKGDEIVAIGSAYPPDSRLVCDD